MTPVGKDCVPASPCVPGIDTAALCSARCSGGSHLVFATTQQGRKAKVCAHIYSPFRQTLCYRNYTAVTRPFQLHCMCSCRRVFLAYLVLVWRIQTSILRRKTGWAGRAIPNAPAEEGTQPAVQQNLRSPPHSGGTFLLTMEIKQTHSCVVYSGRILEMLSSSAAIWLLLACILSLIFSRSDQPWGLMPPCMLQHTLHAWQHE